MEDQIKNSGPDPLNRRAYAKRFGACVVGSAVYGFTVGFALGSMMENDPINAWKLALSLVILGNIVIGGLFTYFTYRRALDCKFGQEGKAWIAVLAALPTMAFPNYGFLVFGVMMLIESAPEDEETFDVADDAKFLKPLEAAE